MSREVINVESHDGLGIRPDGCGDKVAVIFVWLEDPGFEFFPPRDQRIIKGFTHVGESLYQRQAGRAAGLSDAEPAIWVLSSSAHG